MISVQDSRDEWCKLIKVFANGQEPDAMMRHNKPSANHQMMVINDLRKLDYSSYTIGGGEGVGFFPAADFATDYLK